MRGIILKDAIKNFGFKDGFGFWFRWSFVHPLQQFIWFNITHKSYCLYYGFHCERKNCPHKHLKTKEEILKHWEEGHKEMERIEEGKDGTCVYCGEEPGTILIPNPNFDAINRWKVCQTCKEIIKIQQELAFLRYFNIGNHKRYEKLNNKLLEIAENTGKAILNMEITKEDGSYKTSSITFGKK